MDREYVRALLDDMEFLSLEKIELIIGMPINTLQKFLSGERGLPKKWEKGLKVYLGIYTPLKPDYKQIENQKTNEPSVIKQSDGLSKMDKLQKLRVKDL